MIKFNKLISISTDPSKSLLELAIENKIELNHSCGGYGTCGTCRVLIENHNELEPRNEIEQIIATDRDFSPNERLACQTRADREITLTTPIYLAQEK